jgi:hypothetical protein
MTSLIEGLINLEHKNCIIEDLKLENIGYDTDYNCKILDYDHNTIHKLSETKNKIRTIFFTYRPIYIFYDTLTDDKNYSKYSIGGLTEIIIMLYYNNFYHFIISYLQINRGTKEEMYEKFKKKFLNIGMDKLLYHSQNGKHYGLLSDDINNIPPLTLILKYFNNYEEDNRYMDSWLLTKYGGYLYKQKYIKYKIKNKILKY